MEKQDKLIKSFNEGNAGAFRQVYDLYFLRLYNFVKKLLEDRTAAQDVTAEVFIKLWKNRTRFENLAKIKSYLFVVARNKCFDYFKAIKNEKSKIKNYFTFQGHEFIEHHDDPITERLKITADYYLMVEQEIEKLHPQCKEVFRLYYFEGRSNQQIAEELGISDKTVRNQKSIARNTLRAVLKNTDN